MAATLGTLVAMSLHVYLAVQSYKLKLGLTANSLCNINETLNCDAVALSPYAQFLGIPMAVWGAAANLIFLVLLLILFAGGTGRFLRGAFWMGTLILGASAVMGLVSLLFMKNYCLFCLILYVLSVIQWFCIWRLQEESPLALLMGDLQSLVGEGKPIGILFAVVPAAAWLGHSMLSDHYGLRQSQRIIRESLFDWQASPPRDFTKEGLLRHQGGGSAKMVIVEFADFLCPHCKVASSMLHHFLQSRTDVELIFKPFPLDGNCNPGAGSKGDNLRCQLAAAVFCSQSLGAKGWAAHDFVFEHQETWTLSNFPSLLEDFARKHELSLESLKTCLDSPETKEQISRMAMEGHKANILGTPTIFVNGRKLDRGQFFPVLEAAYQSLR